MDYYALARKWRPRSFSQVVGQDHILQPLINSLDTGRVHHAFLFTGIRGVGKTTLARILAKSLNCEEGISSSPCGKCKNCLEINEGNYIDLIEVDAASRTGVDDTRDLLENAHYAPSHGRYKVYLIDEVHMFSLSSFNALLKTLEEPPPHVKFLLATTDPKKIPVTVLSRCLQFNLRRINPKIVAGYLSKILDEEHILFDPEALFAIAQASEGSMRDALSFLDQAINYSNGQITVSTAQIVLGSIDQKNLLILLNYLSQKNSQGLIKQIRELCSYSVDIYRIIRDLLHLLQQIALYQIDPNLIDKIVENEDFIALASRFTPEEIQLYYQIGLIGNRDLIYAPDPYMTFEMLLLRMLCFHPVEVTPDEKTLSYQSILSDSNLNEIVGVQEKEAVLVPREFSPSLLNNNHDWQKLISKLELSGISRQLAENCIFDHSEINSFYLKIAPTMVSLQRGKDRLQEVLSNHLNREVKIIIQTFNFSDNADTIATQKVKNQEIAKQTAIKAVENDENIQAICKIFDAQVLTENIKAVQESKFDS
ncbi:DNA polymerase III subunit gamma/tau [Candidatus Nitrosacidococcus sp. I8]|uniref:DNA polymerase III subunit gamma/tau n=1 Tax=Candidatus Nitrosacidococcus sp. I8 TaxID=2942908 RepID=UPI0022262508|nr:DNA polymerase III subunit gamma/tau [Candidatus Nitrosacidococcus sp. I8]CAH9019694.1 hypothetical protein NURINAE_01692 [Candidatus Nitrosacidococcus sp. I8]